MKNDPHFHLKIKLYCVIKKGLNMIESISNKNLLQFKVILSSMIEHHKDKKLGLCYAIRRKNVN